MHHGLRRARLGMDALCKHVLEMEAGWNGADLGCLVSLGARVLTAIMENYMMHRGLHREAREEDGNEGWKGVLVSDCG